MMLKLFSNHLILMSNIFLVTESLTSPSPQYQSPGAGAFYVFLF